MLKDSSSSSIISRIEGEIKKLANKIRENDEFGKKDILNVHGLVCLMRYAVWGYENSFQEWLLGQEMTHNEGVVKRVYLYKDLDDSKDGVEIRIHLFTDGSETFRHNHGQDFITMCIHGEYEYSYYKIEPDNGHTYQEFVRTPGEGKLLPVGGVKKRGKIVKAKLVDGELYADENADDVKFKEGDLPMFVPCMHHHTVNHVNKDVPVVTFLARRGRRDNHNTTVIQDLSMGHRDAEEDQDPVKVKLEEKDKLEIYETLKSALLKRGHSDIGYSGVNGVANKESDIYHYMTKTKHLVRFLRKDSSSEQQRKLIARFLQSNNFTSAPIMEGKKCVSVLRRPVSAEKKGILQEKSPPSVQIDEHILGAVLWNIVSKDLVVPIVDGHGEMMGIFSISDLVESNEEFDRALIYSIAKHDRTDNGEKIARKFLRRLSELNDGAFHKDQLCTSAELDELVNDLMLMLGPLIVISPDLNHGRFRNVSEPESVEKAWIHAAANFPVYKLEVDSYDSNQVEEAKDLLKMLSRGSDMDQILLDDGDEVKLLSLKEGVVKLKVSDEKTTINEAIKLLSGSEIPLFVKDKKGRFGILTKDDFDGDVAIKQLCKYISETDIDSELSAKITQHIIRVGMGENSTLDI
jgi:hypothetical protein